MTNPLYVGDDHKNHGKIELISRVTIINTAVLIAINLERDSRGRYHISSFYTVKEEIINSRREKGFLVVATKT